MSGLLLYNFDLCERCYKVRLSAACLGIELSLVAVDVIPGRENLSPPMLALNPLGRLPVLADGATVLHGAEAILLHLGLTRDPGHRLTPAPGPALAPVLQWLTFSARDLAVTEEARAAAMFGAGVPDRLRQAARDTLRVMEDHLILQRIDGKGFFTGPDATLADLALFPAFALSRDFDIDHDEFPALRNWARRVRALPGFVTMPGIPDYH